MKNFLSVRRVSFSGSDIPIQKRRYRLIYIDGYIGTIAEIINNVCKPEGFTHILILDIDGRYLVDVDTGKIIDTITSKKIGYIFVLDAGDKK